MMILLNKAIKQKQEVMEKEVPHKKSSKINNAQITNNKHALHSFIETILDDTILACQWLTYNNVINYNCTQAVHPVVATRQVLVFHNLIGRMW